MAQEDIAGLPDFDLTRPARLATKTVHSDSFWRHAQWYAVLPCFMVLQADMKLTGPPTEPLS